MRWIFWGICRNWFLISPLHYLSSRSDFHFEFAEIFGFENDSPLSPIQELTTPHISDTGSRRLPASLIRRVADSPHHWYVESATPRITDMEIWLLNFWKENSLYQWHRESLTPHTSDTVSRWVGESTTLLIIDIESSRLPVSLSRRVNAPHIGDTLFEEKNLFSFDFQYFKRLKHAFKGSFWPKISQGCNLLSKLYYLKVENNCIYRWSCWLPDSPMRGVVFRIQISPRIWSQNRNSSKCSVRDLGQNDLCKNLRKFSSLPCPFNSIIKNKTSENFWI
jgi:hypothetical protein